MPIKLKEIIIPEKKLDKHWVTEFYVRSDVMQNAFLTSSMIPYNENTKDVGEQVTLDTINVLDEVRKDPDAAKIYFLILEYLKKKAIEQGKLEEA